MSQRDASNRQLEAVLAELYELERSIGELEDDLDLPRSPENTPLDVRMRRICERLNPKGFCAPEVKFWKIMWPEDQ